MPVNKPLRAFKIADILIQFLVVLAHADMYYSLAAGSDHLPMYPITLCAAPALSIIINLFVLRRQNRAKLRRPFEVLFLLLLIAVALVIGQVGFRSSPEWWAFNYFHHWLPLFFVSLFVLLYLCISVYELAIAAGVALRKRLLAVKLADILLQPLVALLTAIFFYDGKPYDVSVCFMQSMIMLLVYQLVSGVCNYFTTVPANNRKRVRFFLMCLALPFEVFILYMAAWMGAAIWGDTGFYVLIGIFLASLPGVAVYYFTICLSDLQQIRQRQVLLTEG